MIELRARLEDGGEASAELAASPSTGPPPSRWPLAAPEPARDRWSRSAWRPTSRRRSSAPTPARLDPRPDSPQLGLRDLGRLLEPGTLRGDRGGRRGRSALRRLALAAAAALLPELRARAGARAGRGALRRDGRPGRLLAPGQARDRCWRAVGEAQLVYSDAADRQPGRRADRRHVLEPPPARTTRASSRCSWPTR